MANRVETQGRTAPTKSLLVSAIYFPPHIGGISQMMAQIALNLGPDKVCCMTGTPESGQGDDALGAVRVYRVPGAFSGGRWLQGLRFAWTVGMIMVRERPRALQLATAYDAYLGLLCRRWLGLPYVVYAHGNEVLEAIGSSWAAPAIGLREADGVIANSTFTRELLLQVGVRTERIRVVHPGCDPDHFRPSVRDEELRARIPALYGSGPVILTVGNLVPRKGHDMVIRALPAVLESVKDAVYVILGEGPYRETLEREAEALGVRRHVVFAGHVGADDLPRYYALADVFAMPSRQRSEESDVEGFGIVFLEANACAKPVVAGRSGGIPDAVVDGETGILVDPLDPGAIADALIRLLSNPELAARLGSQGRQRVVRDFTWSRVASDVDAVIGSLVGDGRA